MMGTKHRLLTAGVFGALALGGAGVPVAQAGTPTCRVRDACQDTPGRSSPAREAAAATTLTRGSDPEELTDVRGTLYFSASDGTSGRKLWRSDGTAAGTKRVKDINQRAR